ncbi:MAG: hypothetical protein TREMPRED_005303 [Tremellales sp. Tagirdzhanova-0007]|nr:MAG: hypothetical protein TREMPRED_005303 [Tremellales sp. Tagirdzhanova-0007]
MESFGLPMSFGKKVKGVSVPEPPSSRSVDADSPRRPDRSDRPPTRSHPLVEDENSDEDVGPVSSNAVGTKRKADGEVDGEDQIEQNGDEDSDFEDDGDAEVDRTPVSHEIVLKDHTKVVSALAVDPSGARIASGSHDYDTKLWDFGGMDNRLRPFKSWEANGNYHVHDLDWSLDGQKLLVISGTVQPKVFGRDGEDDGHTAEINGGSWHPTDKTQFLTCSNDSTLRIWDLSNKRKQKQVIVVKSKERGARTRVTACAWSHDGKMVVGGPFKESGLELMTLACMDGSLHVWDTVSNLARPKYSNENAHAKNTETTSVAFARDGFRIASRGGDGTVKLWDIRSIRKPVATASDLGNIYPETNLVFSPDDQFILTGTPAPKGEKGALVFLSSDDLSEQRRVPIGEGTVVRVLWHSRINQIFATLNTGAIHVLYSPHSSIHGALLPLSKMPRSAPRDTAFTAADLKPVIFTPDALPMFADIKHGESLHQKEKRSKKFKPMEPISGAGKGGRLGSSATQGLVQTLFSETLKNEDPREALLKYADKTDQEKT